MISYNKFTDLKNYAYYSHYQFEILSSMMYCKYFLTEAVLAQNDSYIIYDTKYNSNHKDYILSMVDELKTYREIIYSDLSAFSEPDKIDQAFADYTQNKYLLIRMLIASEPSNKLTPFWSAMNQIPTTIFSLVKLHINSFPFFSQLSKKSWLEFIPLIKNASFSLIRTFLNFS